MLVRNPAYWDAARIPELERLVLLPLAEPNTRTAALRSSQVDWIEAPPPDAAPSLQQAGFRIVTNQYIRTTGPGSSPPPRARPGATRGSAAAPTWRLTAPR